jgi:NitT/TauT family transport system permease protein
MAVDRPLWQRVWGGARALFARTRTAGWPDLLVGIALAGLFFGIIDVAREWSGQPEEVVQISTSPWALPEYTFFSLSRGLIAYVLSLAFSLLYGYWAAKDRVAERVLVPLLDILQSIPILGFLPSILLALKALFPRSNIGLELASILTIFTSQAWNITFSFYHSLRSIPLDQREVSTLYRFSGWQRFRWVELPFATIGLVWNSMVGMAGGWFFLMVSEAYKVGDMDFRVPGLGSYMSVAADNHELAPQLWGILAMMLMIIALDQLLWRPVVIWAQKFRIEEGGQQEAMTSWFLDWLRRTQFLRLVDDLKRWLQLRQERRAAKREVVVAPPVLAGPAAERISLVAFLVLLIVLGYGAWKLLLLLLQVPLNQWSEILFASGVTLGRVLLSTAIGTLWALPAGLAIGLSPRLSRILQPVIQVIASFPGPMLFPLLITGMLAIGVSLGWGSILLMLFGTQWYILFNIVAGAMAIPADLREAARSYRMSRWQRFWVLYLPCVFPLLVTGWITAAGGAWNTSIIAEYFSPTEGETIQTFGLGAMISAATSAKNFPMLAATVLVLATVVVLFNRLVWKRLYSIAEERFSLNK